MITLEVESRQRTELIEVTAEVRRAVRASGIPEGMALLFVPHTTAAVTINENADPDVVHDMVMGLDRLVPFDCGYRHAEGNSAAHIKSTLVGCSLQVPVTGGDLSLGTWQGVYFCEFDGPRRRTLQVKVLSG